MGVWFVRVIVDDGVGLEVCVADPDVAGPDVAGRASAVGPAPRPPLVLVHGLGGAKEDFADHVAALAARGPVVTFDLRGHGDSDSPEYPGAYSLDRFAADTLQVIDSLGYGSVALLGHSMGGMAARRAVLRAPDRVAALVLMDTSPGPPPGMDSEIIELGAQIVSGQGIAELKRVMDEFDPLGSPSFQRVLAERSGYREYTEWKEDATFLGASRDLAAAIPGAALAVIPGAGHSPQFENPAEWYRVLDAFLDGSRTP
jgi:3-oxoadipate enol-lactonase